jgi:SUKH-4 immunity protein
MALFVEFLYRLSGFLAEGHRGDDRAARANALRGELAALDPDAFASSDQWWPTAFDRGLAAAAERDSDRDLGAVVARLAAALGRLAPPYGPQHLDPPVDPHEDLADVPPDYAAFLRITDGVACGASGEVRLSPLRQVRSLSFLASELPGGAERWCAIGDVLQNPVFMERTTGEIWWFSNLDIVWYTDPTLESFAKAADSLAAFIDHMVLGSGYAEHVSSGPDDWVKAVVVAPAG